MKAKYKEVYIVKNNESDWLVSRITGYTVGQMVNCRKELDDSYLPEKPAIPCYKVYGDIDDVNMYLDKLRELGDFEISSAYAW